MIDRVVLRTHPITFPNSPFLAVTAGSTNVAADAQRNDADITLPVSNVRLYTCILTYCSDSCRQVEMFSCALEVRPQLI